MIATDEYKSKNRFKVCVFCRIVLKLDNDIKYFVLALETFYNLIWISGSAQPKLTQDNLNNLWLYFTPLKE